MGGNTYSKTDTPERKVSEKFVTWLNGIEFRNDKDMMIALYEIRDECSVRISAMEEEEAAAINKAEAEGS